MASTYGQFTFTSLHQFIHCPSYQKMTERVQSAKDQTTIENSSSSRDMSGFKRDRQGNTKRHDGPRPAPKLIERNAYTPMFEHLRDELDAHHDRRDRIGKASRDITALSKKM